MGRLSRIDFLAALIALVSVLLLGILDGILLAAVASVVLLLLRVSRPHVAFLGRVPGTRLYSDSARHLDNEPLSGAIAFRPEASLIYVNTDEVYDTVMERVQAGGRGRHHLVVCDLSACPMMDLAGVSMLHRLHDELERREIRLRVIGAHGSVRDLLRAGGLSDKVEGVTRDVTLDDLLGEGAG
jgi:MFS superfamily sulfate permease-like transporter